MVVRRYTVAVLWRGDQEQRRAATPYNNRCLGRSEFHEGRTRVVLDQMLRDVAARGPWVSAHPDVILKMGVKEVLHRTKHLGWGTDTTFIDQWPISLGHFHEGFEHAARVSLNRTAETVARAFGGLN